MKPPPRPEGGYKPVIDRLKGKLDSGQGNKKRIRRRLDAARSGRYLHQQAKAPPVMPWDTQYENTVSGLNQQHVQGQNQIAAAQGRLGKEYGFTDPSNPYSRAMTLSRAFQTQQKQSMGEFAGRGQLYSGALQNRMDKDILNADEARYGLQQEYTGAMGDLTNQGLDLTNQYNQGILDASGERLAAAAEQRPEAAPNKPGYLRRYLKRKGKKK